MGLKKVGFEKFKKRTQWSKMAFNSTRKDRSE
jgi:hypothetical protein